MFTLITCSNRSQFPSKVIKSRMHSECINNCSFLRMNQIKKTFNKSENVNNNIRRRSFSLFSPSRFLHWQVPRHSKYRQNRLQQSNINNAIKKIVCIWHLFVVLILLVRRWMVRNREIQLMVREELEVRQS